MPAATAKAGKSRSHPGQDEIHLQLGHTPPQTRPHAEPERHRTEGVLLGFLLFSSQPPLRLEDAGVGEDGLVVGHAVVAQVEQRLWGRGEGRGGGSVRM